MTFATVSGSLMTISQSTSARFCRSGDSFQSRILFPNFIASHIHRLSDSVYKPRPPAGVAIFKVGLQMFLAIQSCSESFFPQNSAQNCSRKPMLHSENDERGPMRNREESTHQRQESPTHATVTRSSVIRDPSHGRRQDHRRWERANIKPVFNARR